MNQVSAKKLLHSKWTVQTDKVGDIDLRQKEKHFTIVKVEYDELKQVVECVIEAVVTNRRFQLDWKTLKDPKYWKMGWK